MFPGHPKQSGKPPAKGDSPSRLSPAISDRLYSGVKGDMPGESLDFSCIGAASATYPIMGDSEYKPYREYSVI